jgi:cysteinyl-tRNA synthetase
MSKSLDNFLVPRDIIKTYRPEVVRFFMLSAHYRSPLDFRPEHLAAAQAGLTRLYNGIEDLLHNLAAATERELTAEEQQQVAALDGFRERFIADMDNDLNTADAFAVLFDLVRDANSNITATTARGVATAYLDLFREFDAIFGVLGPAFTTGQLDERIEGLIAQRQAARKARNWAEADRIRDELAAEGIVLEDTPQGVRWKRRSSAGESA